MGNGFHSKNMNYIFYKEYFKIMEDMGYQGNDENKEKVLKGKFEQNNKNIKNFSFSCEKPFWGELEKAQNFRSIDLETIYPGLLIGIGEEHDSKIAGAVKCGFTFDYVTGIPVYPGSSLKGMLRSYFPGERKEEEKEEYEEYIKAILQECSCACTDIAKLETQIFEKDDIFLGAYPISKGELMDLEYITPHKEQYKNPIPINLIKVRPGVKFKFGFLLSDYKDAESTVTAQQKIELFRRIILDMGVGAKTNVGFGKFRDTSAAAFSRKTR